MCPSILLYVIVRFIHPCFIHSIHYSLTFSLQAQNLPFQQILSTVIDFWYPGLPLRIIGLDRTYHAHRSVYF